MYYEFLVWYKKFGPDQNILGPVKGQGISIVKTKWDISSNFCGLLRISKHFEDFGPVVGSKLFKVACGPNIQWSRCHLPICISLWRAIVKASRILSCVNTGEQIRGWRPFVNSCYLLFLTITIRKKPGHQLTMYTKSTMGFSQRNLYCIGDYLFKLCWESSLYKSII